MNNSLPKYNNIPAQNHFLYSPKYDLDTIIEDERDSGDEMMYHRQGGFGSGADVDFEVQHINHSYSKQPPINSTSPSKVNAAGAYITNDNSVHSRKNMMPHHSNQNPLSQEEMEQLLEERYQHQIRSASALRANRPSSAGRVAFQQNTITRPSSAKTIESAVTPHSARERSSSASQQRNNGSYLRQKLAFPNKVSSIPPPQTFPISSSRSTNSVLTRENEHLAAKQVARSYLSKVNKKLKLRKIPENFLKDPEGMYMDMQELKEEIVRMQNENTKLKTQLRKAEAGHVRKQKQVEELLRAHAIVETKGSHFESMFKEMNLVKRLKEKVRDLEFIITEKDEEFERIKRDSRYTRVRELETELKAYYTESRRLTKVVEQTKTIQDNHNRVMDEMNRIREENSKLRELVVNMKQVQDYYQNQLSHLSQYKDEVSRLSQDLELTKQEREKLTRDNISLSAQVDNLHRELEVLQDMSEKTPTSKPLTIGTNEELESLKLLISNMKQLERDLSEKLSAKERENSALLVTLDEEKKKGLIQNEVQIEELSKKIAQLEQDKEARENQLQELTKTLGEKNEVIQEVRKENEALKTHTSPNIPKDQLSAKHQQLLQQVMSEEEEEIPIPKKRAYTFDEVDDKKKDLTYDQAANVIGRTWKKHRARKQNHPRPSSVLRSNEETDDAPNFEDYEEFDESPLVNRRNRYANLDVDTETFANDLASEGDQFFDDYEE